MEQDIFIHSSSFVSNDAYIGKGTKIWQFCTILAGAKIGENSLISQNVYVEGGSIIGNNVKIKNNVSVYDSVELEDYVFVGPSVVFINVINPRSHWHRKDQFQKTLIRRGATLGANSTIKCGICVGQYAMVGAGSVVTKDIPDYALVYGNPTKEIGWVCYCGEIIGEMAIHTKHKCIVCGNSYFLSEVGLQPIKK